MCRRRFIFDVEGAKCAGLDLTLLAQVVTFGKRHAKLKPGIHLMCAFVREAFS